ncbi:MAG: prepilin-type N-terminal cleavage/methylation domain-containing protein [Candidatus Gracilibacteria bacterium]
MKNERQKKPRNMKAFTLVELIISMVIFTVFVGVASTTYIYVSRALRHAAEVRSVYAETRFLMDKITQDVRLYTIDYECYEAAAVMDSSYGSDYGECSGASSGLSAQGQTSSLHLISADGLHRVSYRFQDGEFSILELDYDTTAVNWIASEGYYSGFQLFETQRVDLDYVQFMIKPLSSPYENYTRDNSHYQPSVNVVIAARSMSTLLPEVLQVKMQSTIASRVYGVEF